MQEAVIDLAQQLARLGLLELLPPCRNDTPERYLLRQYVSQHQAVLGLADIHIQCLINRHYTSGAHLDLIVTPRRKRYVCLSRLYSQLTAVHPDLFGAVVSYLKTLLAPYDPLFTGEDAVQADIITYYDENYENDIFDDYIEAHPNDPAPDLNTAAQWAKSLGRRTHLDLAQRYPPSTYEGAELALSLLDLSVSDGSDHIAALRAFVAYLERLPKNFQYPQEWHGVGDYPGEMTVIMVQPRDVDPVAEAYDDLTELFGEIQPEQTEPMQILSITGQQDHELALEYFGLVANVQRRAQRLWSLVADPA